MKRGDLPRVGRKQDTALLPPRLSTLSMSPARPVSRGQLGHGRVPRRSAVLPRHGRMAIRRRGGNQKHPRGNLRCGEVLACND